MSWATLAAGPAAVIHFGSPPQPKRSLVDRMVEVGELLDKQTIPESHVKHVRELIAAGYPVLQHAEPLDFSPMARWLADNPGKTMEDCPWQVHYLTRDQVAELYDVPVHALDCGTNGTLHDVPTTGTGLPEFIAVCNERSGLYDNVRFVPEPPRSQRVPRTKSKHAGQRVDKWRKRCGR